MKCPSCGHEFGGKTYVVEADIHRVEELRTDRLGPTEKDVVGPGGPLNEDRPLRTLD